MARSLCLLTLESGVSQRKIAAPEINAHNCFGVFFEATSSGKLIDVILNT
jgi:hypothetical protein